MRESDIWVITYPKCGTTWTQEMVWQIANDVDIKVKTIFLHLIIDGDSIREVRKCWRRDFHI